jgi:hypothetical protein
MVYTNWLLAGGGRQGCVQLRMRSVQVVVAGCLCVTPHAVCYALSCASTGTCSMR